MKLKKLLSLSAITVILLLIGLVAVEFYLRQSTTQIIRQGSNSLGLFVESDPEFLIKYTVKGRRLIPNTDVIIKNHYLSKRNIKMKINSMGFRDDEISKDKKNDEFRILILGDSITLGDYLQAEEVYVEQIEKYLDKSILDRNIEVINGGVGDIGIKEEIDILLEQGLSIEPDVVIVSFYLNDSRPPWGFPGELGHRGIFRRHSVLINTLYRYFMLRQWIKEQGEYRLSWVKEINRLDWRENRQDFLKLAKLAKYDWGAAWESESWDSVEKYFGKLKSIAKKHHFTVVVVTFPVVFQVLMNDDNNYPQERLHRIADRYGFGYFDLLPLLRKHNNDILFFDQCHPQKNANALIGKEIAKYLEKEILITK